MKVNFQTFIGAGQARHRWAFLACDKVQIMGNATIEKKLKFLFGLQRIEQDPELKEVIDDSENSAENLVKLSDFDLFSVAAGTGNGENDPKENKREYCFCPICQQNTFRQHLSTGEYYCESCKNKYYDQ